MKQKALYVNGHTIGKTINSKENVCHCGLGGLERRVWHEQWIKTSFLPYHVPRNVRPAADWGNEVSEARAQGKSSLLQVLSVRCFYTNKDMDAWSSRFCSLNKRCWSSWATLGLDTFTVLSQGLNFALCWQSREVLFCAVIQFPRAPELWLSP